MCFKSQPTPAAVICVVCAAFLAAIAPAPVAAQDWLWKRQIGTTDHERVHGVAVDGAGNAYFTGSTLGSLAGPIAGDSDIFLAKYDAAGNLLFTRQIGTAENDAAFGVALDGSGNAYLSGRTFGSLGGPSAGDQDVLLAKYDAAGNLLFTRQIGTTEGDVASGVAVDGAGNAYITGLTSGSLFGPSAGGWDAFLAKYDASGTLLWTRQIGTPVEDRATGVGVDGAGNAYIGGYTYGSLFGPNAGIFDVFLAKYDAAGNLLWTRQIGTASWEGVRDVAVNGAGDAYITGWTGGSFFGPSAGDHDAFLAKFDAAGVLLWTRQIGTPDEDVAHGVAVDGAGDAYITGFTNGSLGGPSAGHGDAFLAKYDAAGTWLFTRQIGTGGADSAFGVAVDGADNAYIAGQTQGSLGGPHAGGLDAFLAKYGDASCYADCDTSTGVGVLDVFDFLCFQNSFVNGDPYACDCDTSTGNGVCDVFDFLCFQDAFVGGCP